MTCAHGAAAKALIRRDNILASFLPAPQPPGQAGPPPSLLALPTLKPGWKQNRTVLLCFKVMCWRIIQVKLVSVLPLPYFRGDPVFTETLRSPTKLGKGSTIEPHPRPCLPLGCDNKPGRLWAVIVPGGDNEEVVCLDFLVRVLCIISVFRT